MMKNVKNIFFLVLSIFFFSCDSDFDEDRLSDGTWYLKNVRESFIILNDWDEELETTNYYPAKSGDLAYRFNPDGTFQVRAAKPTHFGGMTYETWKTGKWSSERGWIYLEMEECIWEYHLISLKKRSLSLEYYDGDVRITEVFERKDW